MSSMPPNMPPNTPPGGGQPPYDPQTQWRSYREQQKAAWRAQRDQWRAQRHAWKANYVGMYGPRVPSMVGPIILVCIGVIALLVISGHLDAGTFWMWYGHWWPLLLIGAGLALLGEWALDMRRKTPVRRSGGFIGILIFLAFLGAIAAAHNHFWGPFHGDFGDGSFFSTFGMPEHDSDQPVDNRQIPANASIEIRVPRGDVSITASDQPNLEVHAQEVAYANSDSGAKKIFDAEAAQVTVNGSAVLIQAQSNDRGRVNLSVSVPKTAHVTVNAGWDSVTASGLDAGIDITARGDIHLSSITGPVVAHFVRGEHDVFAAQDVQGDMTLEGDVNDITVSDIKGGIAQNGDIPGDVSMENVTGPVHLRTSVTTVDAVQLPGELILNDDDLRVIGAKGQVHVTTHSKDVDLSQIDGDSHVEDRDGNIRIELTGTYSADATNSKGDVEITLPPNASATVSGHTHNGEVVTDFGLTVSGDEDKTVTGLIGSGTAHIVLSADNGDLHIKKGSAVPPEEPTAPSAPAPPNARHLKSPKTPPAQPVTQ
ncbi:MAG: DUF4097 family beta strand repeat-containing protein [Terracidiphilus sp.]